MAIEPLTPERRRQQTRDYLLRAAAQVFTERGLHDASIDEIAAVAGFTKGAVYSNFKSKDDLYLALLEERYERDMAALRAILTTSGDSPNTNLSDFAANIRDQIEQDGDSWGALYQEYCAYAQTNPQARAKLAEFQRTDIETIAAIIDSERKRHTITPAESSDHAARIVIALIRGLISMRLIDTEAVDFALLESAVAFIGRAMMTTTEASGLDRASSSSPSKRRPPRGRTRKTPT